MRVCVSSKILRSKKGGLPDARCPSPPLADPEASKDLSDTTGHTGRPEYTPKMDPLGIETQVTAENSKHAFVEISSLGALRSFVREGLTTTMVPFFRACGQP
jgi:hypothetical protein